MSGIFAAMPDAFVGAFGEAMTWLPQDGISKGVWGIFSAPSEVVRMFDGQVASSAIKADFRDAEITGVRQGDGIARGEENYRVVAIHRDGQGMTSLILEET